MSMDTSRRNLLKATAALAALLSFPVPAFASQPLLANNPTYPDTKVDVGPGTIKDTTGTYDLELTSGVTADLGSTWASGGNLDQGSLSADSSYHVHLIRKDSDGSVAVLVSASALNPLIPSGYTERRRLGAVETDGGGNIHPFMQVARDFFFTTPIQVTNHASNNVATLRDLPVPTGIKVKAHWAASFFGSSGGGYLIMWDPDLGVPSVTSTYGAFFRKTNSDAVSGSTWTNTAGQIYSADTGSSTDITLFVTGFHDDNEAYP